MKENVANFKVNKVQKITIGDKVIGELEDIYGYYIEFGNEKKGIFTMEDLKTKTLGKKFSSYGYSFNFSIKENVFYDLLGDLIGVLSDDFEEYKLFYNVGWHGEKYSFPNNDINLEFPLYKKYFAYKNSDKSVYNLKDSVKLYNKIKEEDIRLLLLGTLISGVLHTKLKGIGQELNKIVLINTPQSDTKVLTELYLKMFDYNIGNIALSSKGNMIDQLIANTKDDVAVIDGNNESDNNQTVKNNIKELEKVFCSGTAINYSDTRKERMVCSSASNLVIFSNKMSNYMNTENYIYLEISDDLGIEMEDINTNKLLWEDMMKLFINFCEDHIETLFLNRPHIPENVDDKYKGCYATYWYALTTFEDFLQEYKLEGLEKILELSKNYLDIISDFFRHPL